MTNRFFVDKLDRPYRSGHREPLFKWMVRGEGEGANGSHFFTKAGAMRYASLRRRHPTKESATRAYVRGEK